jgi:hypothetical protein
VAAFLIALCAVSGFAATAAAEDDADRLGPVPGGWRSLPAVSPRGDDADGVPTFARVAAQSGGLADAPIDRRVRAQPVYAPLGDVSRGAAGEQPVQLTNVLSADEARDARAAAVGALALSVDADTRLRAGGGGRLSVSMPAQLADAPAVSDVRTTIHVPRAYRIGRVDDGGWRCARSGQALTCRAPGRAAAGSLDAIGVGLVAVHRGAGAHVRVRSSWDQAGSGRRTASAALALRPRPPVRVRTSTARRTVLAPSAGDASPVLLNGRLKGMVDGTPLRYRWRQLSGPKATIVAGASGVATTSVVTAQLRLPEVTRERTLRFRLSASDVRGTGTSDIRLRVLPASVAKLDPRLGALANVRTLTPPQRRLRGHRVRDGLTRAVTIGGNLTPRAGQVARLHAVGVGGAVRQARWRVSAGGDEVVRRGTHLALRLPRTAKHLRVRVEAVVGGASVSSHRTLHLSPARDARARQRRAVALAAQADPPEQDDDGDDQGDDEPLDRAGDDDQDETTTDDDADEKPAGPFCQILKAVNGGDATGGGSLSLANGTKVTLGGAIASGADCDADDAKVRFDRATFKVGVLSFEDVAGTVTADGLTVNGGTLVLSDFLSERLGGRPSVHFDSVGLFAALRTTSGSRWPVASRCRTASAGSRCPRAGSTRRRGPR